MIQIFQFFLILELKNYPNKKYFNEIKLKLIGNK